MLKRMLIMSAALLVVFGGIFGWKWRARAQAEKRAEPTPPPVTVSAVTARSETWHPVVQAIATLRAVQGTDISPQVGGLVSEINFESGQQVRAGDLLVQLDVSVEEAQLQGLEAAESLAQIELTRVQD